MQLAFEAVSHISGFSVLEVGCHSTSYAQEFLQSGARRVVTVDVAPAQIAPAQPAKQAAADGKHEHLQADLLAGEIADKFDIVVALDAFGWITKEPHTLLARMGEMASQKVIARFPGGAGLGDRLRRLWAGGPGLSYTGRDVRMVAHQARLPNFRIEKLREDGYILIATMRGRRSGAAQA
jgi:predicted RNA methylase